MPICIDVEVSRYLLMYPSQVRSTWLVVVLSGNRSCLGTSVSTPGTVAPTSVLPPEVLIKPGTLKPQPWKAVVGSATF